VKVHFNRGFSDQLPYADASFDRVSCTGMFSLLPLAEKETTLANPPRAEAGGSFHLFDLVKMPPGSSLWVRLLPSRSGFQVCTEEQTVALMHEAGLADPGRPASIRSGSGRSRATGLSIADRVTPLAGASPFRLAIGTTAIHNSLTDFVHVSDVYRIIGPAPMLPVSQTINKIITTRPSSPPP